jgi:hypothetical protein
MNIVNTLDEIDEQIKQISNKDEQRESRFDFDNASDDTVEWSRHNLRAAQQNAEKSNIIKKLCLNIFERNKVNILGKVACQCSSDHSQ